MAFSNRLDTAELRATDVCLLMCSLYGYRLRSRERVRRRVQDIDFGQNQIKARDAKGMKDRVTVLPNRIKIPLQEHLQCVKILHDKGLTSGHGHFYLPFALER